MSLLEHVRAIPLFENGPRQHQRSAAQADSHGRVGGNIDRPLQQRIPPGNRIIRPYDERPLSSGATLLAVQAGKAIYQDFGLGAPIEDLLGRVLIYLRPCPLRSDTDATAANDAKGREPT